MDHRDGWECPTTEGQTKATKGNQSFVLKDNAGVKTRGNKMDRKKVRLEIRGKSVPREQPEH